MSQIEKQIANSLFDSNGTSSGASDCYKIALEFAKGFAEWTVDNAYGRLEENHLGLHLSIGEWLMQDDWKGTPVTTDQLIDKYLEHLETIK